MLKIKIKSGSAQIEYLKENFNNQSGVTLLLAILVLSSIMAISFSLATIMFVEVRSSNDLAKTEPAYYGANAVVDEAIFNIKRNVCGTNCSYTSQFSNNVNLPTAPITTSTTTPIFQDRIPPGTNFNSAKVYSLFNANSSNPSINGSNYGRIKLNYLDTGNTDPLYVYLCQFDPNEAVDPSGLTPNTYSSTACSNPTTVTVGSDTYWHTANFQMIPGTTYGSSYTWDIDPGKQQQLILFNPATSGNYIYVKIETFGPSPTYTPIGLPYAGQTAVEINARNSAVGRKLRVVIPNTVSTGVTSGVTDTIWVEDSIPAGAVSQQDPFNWQASNPAPISGSLANQSQNYAGIHQQYFTGATEPFVINAGDSLIAYVYLDSVNTPTEIMLQWDDGSGGWAHRAYWGANVIPWGTNGTQTRFQVSSSIPATGQWVRLEVPASSVGLEGVSLRSMAFTLNDGKATWDKAGKSSVTSIVPTNISQGKTASQISTFPGLVAGNAVDGNTNGAYSTDPISHTGGGSTDWWQVDLGATYNVSSVVVWNRTDCCKLRLTDYWIYISNTPGGTDYPYHQTSYPDPSSTISTSGASGRYVRIQLSGSAANNDSGYYLNMGEVQVFGY